MRARPFVKWAGGKTQLLNQIRKYYPGRIEKYCEPFVGGGAVLFDVLSSFDVGEVLINDINPELVNTYIHIRDNTGEVVEYLKRMEKEYYSASDKRGCFLEMRSRFNSLILSRSDTTEKAALFIALNKTCFNGLYRVNSKGLFNVSHNKSVHPLICDEENIRSCGEILGKTKITRGDYRNVEGFIDERTFLFVDPPYRPLSSSSSFTSYNETGFDDEDQIALSQFLRNMVDRGASVLLSNSDPKNTDSSDNFFDDLYKDFTIERVSASRMINSKGSGRGPLSELLISRGFKSCGHGE